MKLIKYDEATETSTIALTDIELVDLHSVFAGVLSTFRKQDPTVLGVTKERLTEVEEGLMSLLEKRNSSVGETASYS